MASSSRLKPNEKGKISVSVDVRGKQGAITKTVQVFTNDMKNPVVTLSISMRIRDAVHMKKFKADEIFRENCRNCHVDQGKGKKGLELFNADCFMCHKTGSSAASLKLMSKKPKEYLIKATRDGVAGSMMPGWNVNNSGPLNEDEIESLVNAILNPN